ncbi:hypothetical protein PX860_12280 [Agrobacterium leguminum]|uniref:hypothetical protein n=1 Tax=Agrobacterium leguminum TaxID=2792015 RepID=UPI00272B9F52|nr:hypothetical protein [Agrobacterium leguminum]WLD96324.1 hypothetical protein PX860_12280 [Agrobacterium leguminum]
MAGYIPGMESIFGGLLVSVIIMRIGRPDLYIDWICAGIVQVCLGFILVKSPDLEYFSVFFIAMLLLATLRVFIGMTIPSASLWAGGLTTFFCLASSTLDRVASFALAPDVIVATDLALTGISIASFGLSIRSKEREP